MEPALKGLYAEWRERLGIVPPLHEKSDSPPEALLQAVWQHQRLKREDLKTTDGQPVEILHPGFQSVEGGPDFRGAMIRFPDGVRSGDVEVDIRSSGWRSHGHDRNPAFKNVILHVLWDAEKPLGGTPPALCLKPWLDAPIGELNFWLGSEGAHSWPEALRGKCRAPLQELGDAAKSALLMEAARVRFQAKAAGFQARARQAGWDQALWEGLFRALGYKQNVWPMQRVGELRARWALRPDDVIGTQARLFGVSGLLPAELTRSAGAVDSYLRRIWDHWWRERDAFADCVLPKGVWRLHGLRPANHPQRRLGLAARWPANGEIANRLEAWCAADAKPGRLVDSLLECLRGEADDFWSWHYTFRSARLKKAQPLLGSARAADIAINVVLPWLWMRAEEGKNKPLIEKIEGRYFTWPAAEDNSLLRLARERLLGGASKKSLPTAAAQQGLIQIVRDFCERSNALCEACKFPDLVRNWPVV
ncbi:MAG TPA: DUF2851 family protein [Verrucomicrobiae bacterium]|nr:DUF2851 family protein [Verrucomicrobiae bacterium]